MRQTCADILLFAARMQIRPGYVQQIIVDELFLLGEHGMHLHNPITGKEEKVFVKLLFVMSDYPGLIAALGSR